MPTQPLFIPVQLFTTSAADCVQDDKMKTFANVEKLPKSHLEIVIFDAIIPRLIKLCFSDGIYLVLCRHPVMMTCYSSLFCALYLYIIRLFFTVFLWIYHPFLCHICN